MTSANQAGGPSLVMLAWKVLALAALGTLALACREDARQSRLGQLAESAKVNATLGPPPATSPASLLRDSAAADSAAMSH